jgi:rare lipoprotein A
MICGMVTPAYANGLTTYQPHHYSTQSISKIEEGIASVYSSWFYGRKTASGNRLNLNEFTIAHRSLPFGTVVLLQNKRNGKIVKAIVTDRGPYVRGRIVDATYAVAKSLGMIKDGIVPIMLSVVDSHQ